MNTYSPHLQSHLTGRRNPVVTLAIALVAGSAVLGLLVSGVTFLALGLAFALAVPIAQHYTVSISAADIALAGRIAEFWWVFATISVASFIGALVVAVKTVRHLGSPPR